MKKLNKKGFTLIEMLVVIAIIAILVAIVVPTVTSATGKSKAATDAANLRSALAEATILALNGDDVPEDAASYGVPATSKLDSDLAFTVDYDAAGDNETGAEITITYGDYTIEDFAYYAENGEFPE